MPSPILHVRADEEMLDRIDAFAAQAGVDRSVAVRSLLALALGDSVKSAAAREVMMLLSKERKFALSKFNDVLQTAITEMRHNIERDA